MLQNLVILVTKMFSLDQIPISIFDRTAKIFCSSNAYN